MNRKLVNRQRTIVEILDIAKAQIDSDNFDVLNLREIAKDLGVSAPAVLHYFSTKDDLKARLLTEGFSEFFQYNLNKIIENKDKLIESNENDLPKEKTDDEVLVDGEKKIEERAIYSNSSSLSSKGSSLDMQGWTWDFAPKPDDKSTEGGRIVFEIIVDYYGEIIGLKTLETTLSPMVENIYREEILKLTFTPTNNENPAELSKGKITFIIKNN